MKWRGYEEGRRRNGSIPSWHRRDNIAQGRFKSLVIEGTIFVNDIARPARRVWLAIFTFFFPSVLEQSVCALSPYQARRFTPCRRYKDSKSELYRRETET